MTRCLTDANVLWEPTRTARDFERAGVKVVNPFD